MNRDRDLASTLEWRAAELAQQADQLARAARELWAAAQTLREHPECVTEDLVRLAERQTGDLKAGQAA